MKERLIVIGNGMAAGRVVEEIRKRAPEKFDIVMFGAEPYGNYNRILLSNVLNQTQKPQEIVRLQIAIARIQLEDGVEAFPQQPPFSPAQLRFPLAENVYRRI